MSIATPFGTPFFTGTGVTDLVPRLWPVALNGRPYMLDTKHPSWGRQSIPLLRQQADNSAVPAEASLNPSDLWRRAVESWHHGAGQTRFDRPDSDPARFRFSKGIHVWDRWGISLLPDTASVRGSVNTNLRLETAGARLYVIDGTELRYTTDVTVGSPSWTNVTAVPATAPTSIASDGFNVYTAHGAAGIYRTDTGSAVTASYVTGTAAGAIVAFVKGRLMVADLHKLYNVTAAGALPAALFTANNTDFRFVGFAEGTANLYAAGFSGDKSLIYRTGIKTDGTALDAPVVAGQLPDGEIVRSIGAYLGYIVLGTDKGVRFCDADSTGNLLIGSLIATPAPVRCFEGQDRFVWFGMENYDGVSTGLGRLDLTAFVAQLTPAWASDLMATGQGQVTSVVTFGNRRVFAVSGLGVFAEQLDRVPAGTIDSGLVTFGLPDDKVALYLDLRHEALAGSVAASMSADGDTFSPVGGNTIADTSSIVLPTQITAETFETRLTLTRSSLDTHTGPTIGRVTMEANPAPGRGEFLFVPLLLHESVDLPGRGGASVPEHVDVATEYALLLDLEASGRPFSYQSVEGTSTVFLDDHEFDIYGPTSDGSFMNGTFLAKLRRPRQRST